jgi:hypothetical protein
MKKSLRLELPDELVAALDHIVEVSGKNRTQVVSGMIEHWEAVIRDHERRGFLVRPLPDRSLACAMVGDRAGVFDDAAPAGAPGGNISAEMSAPAG